jgi:hypothetical protein
VLLIPLYYKSCPTLYYIREVYYVASKVFPLRASEEERAEWQAAADAVGLSFNGWARRSLNEQVGFERALVRGSQAGFVGRENAARAAGHVCATNDLGSKFKPDPR